MKPRKNCGGHLTSRPRPATRQGVSCLITWTYRWRQSAKWNEDRKMESENGRSVKSASIHSKHRDKDITPYYRLKMA